MINPPRELLARSHFARYFNAWQRNQRSIVFVPLSEICREHGYLQEAREICETGLRFHPESVSGRLALARIYWDLKETGPAIPALQGVLTDYPSHREAEELLCRWVPGKRPASGGGPAWETCTMAGILAAQGDRQGARILVEKILAREPGDQRARRLKEELCGS